MRGRRVARLSGLAVAALVVGLVSPLAGTTVAHADVTYPNAQVDSPADGASVSGVVSVTGEAHLDPTGSDTTTTLALLVNGTPTGDPVNCDPTTPTDCTGIFHWDTTGLSPGDYHLSVELASTLPDPFDSDPITVTVPTPIADPTVAFTGTTPTTATGPVTFTATGTVDPRSSHKPSSLRLVVDGTAIASTVVTCPGTGAHNDANTCQQDLIWDTTNVADGAHSVVVRLTTSNSGGHVDSDPVTVTTSNPGPTVHITSPANDSAEAGVFNVKATGTTDGSTSELPDRMQLLLGPPGPNARVLDTQTCQATPCKPTLTWDATGQSGVKTLTVEFFTLDGLTATDTVTVNVTSPGPTLVMTTPQDGATVSGDVPVTVTGTVDASQNDSAGTMHLHASDGFDSTVPCPSNSKTCTVTFTYPGSGKTGARTLTATFKTVNGITAALVSHTVQLITDPPTVTIVSPAGSAIQGLMTVKTHGQIDAAQKDAPVSMQFVATQVGSAVAAYISPPTACPAEADPKACAVTFQWDTTGLSGTYTVQAQFTSQHVTAFASAPTTITITSPAPTATIVSPTHGGTVHDSANIVVAGVVNATQTDTPHSMVLTIDGRALSPKLCLGTPAAARSCRVGFTWNTKGLSGRHTLTATFTTSAGRTAHALTQVYVYAATRIGLLGIRTQHTGHSLTVTGRVTALINRSSVAGVRVKVTFVPGVGKAHSFYVLTNAHGYFRVTVTPTVSSTVAARMLPMAYYRASVTSTKFSVVGHPICSVGSTVRHNVLDHGACTLSHLPKGAAVTLQYAIGGRWFTLGAGAAPGATIPFSFRFARPGSYLLRLLFARNRALAATTGPSLKVAVT